jgi:hypothetical protein
MKDQDRGTVVTSGKTFEVLTGDYVRSTKEREKAMSEARRAARAVILPDIAALFVAEPDLQRIEVDGTTPNFNDGDPCVHNQNDPKINGRYAWGDEDDDAKTMPEIPKATFSRISSVLSGMEDALETAFGTDWTLTFRRAPTGIEWTREENSDHD